MSQIWWRKSDCSSTSPQVTSLTSFPPTRASTHWLPIIIKTHLSSIRETSRITKIKLVFHVKLWNEISARAETAENYEKNFFHRLLALTSNTNRSGSSMWKENLCLDNSTLLFFRGKLFNYLLARVRKVEARKNFCLSIIILPRALGSSTKRTLTTPATFPRRRQPHPSPARYQTSHSEKAKSAHFRGTNWIINQYAKRHWFSTLSFKSLLCHEAWKWELMDRWLGLPSRLLAGECEDERKFIAPCRERWRNFFCLSRMLRKACAGMLVIISNDSNLIPGTVGVPMIVRNGKFAFNVLFPLLRCLPE